MLHRFSVKAVYGFTLLLFAACFAHAAQAFETTAPTAILVDLNSGRTLYAKNPDAEIPPASLAKLMTVTVIFEALRQGRIKRDDTFLVSEYAWKTGGAGSGGSTMFLPVRSRVSVDALIKGIIIQSGNDAAIVAAEGIDGSVEAFAREMNDEARKIGLTNSHFTNPHGLPDPDQHVTVADLAKLAAYLIQTFPDEYHLFSEESFTFNGITQRNRNPLLALGADGLKTGYTDKSGYGLVASAERSGRRIVLAMSGMRSTGERAEEARRLMEYGLQDFEEVTLAEAGKPLGDVTVRDGLIGEIALVTHTDLKVLVPRGSLDGMQRQIIDNGPVKAPVRAGQRLGWVRFRTGDQTVQTLPLYAAGSVEEAPLWLTMSRTIRRNLTWRMAGTP